MICDHLRVNGRLENCSGIFQIFAKLHCIDQIPVMRQRQLLINIFEKNTPLHDGAVIVRGDRVVSATCYLPLTDSLSLSKDLGTRHRAAVGISEVSDSLTIVVSEETGKVSIALDGELYRNVDAEFLKNKLAYIQKREQDTSKVKSWRRRLKDVTKIRKESNE